MDVAVCRQDVIVMAGRWTYFSLADWSTAS